MSRFVALPDSSTLPLCPACVRLRACLRARVCTCVKLLERGVCVCVSELHLFRTSLSLSVLSHLKFSVFVFHTFFAPVHIAMSQYVYWPLGSKYVVQLSWFSTVSCYAQTPVTSLSWLSGCLCRMGKLSAVALLIQDPPKYWPSQHLQKTH